MTGVKLSETAGRWLWLTPLLGLGLAVAVFLLLGVALWPAIIAALLLVCLALMIWGVILLGRNPGDTK